MNALIRPVLSGSALRDQIRSTLPREGGVAVWWLGQSGYVIKGRSATVVVDPYLSEHLTRKYESTSRPHVRMTEAPLRGGELDSASLILASHKHSDHLDPGTLPDLMAASLRADLLYPAAIEDHVRSLGLDLDRCLGVDAGDLHLRPGVTIRPTPSAHESLDRDEFGRHPYLGFVIEIDGVRIYHSGDTVVHPGLAEALGSEPFDIVFLPINGRDPGRGVSGNMTASEAVDFAATIRPRYVVPHHYDMFTFNTVPVEHFLQQAGRLGPGVEAKVLRCGERWEAGPWE